MRSLLILAALVGVTMARPGIFGLSLGAGSQYHSPIPYSALISEGILPNLLAAGIPFPYPAPFEISSQYHTQDEKGQYSYGYAAGPSAKNEVRTADGVTQGAYAYIDAKGEVQSVNYMSDPVNGFRVAATNLPVAPKPIPVEPLVAPIPVEDTPEVAAAKKAHFAAYAKAKAAADAAPDDPEPAKGTAAVPAAVEPEQVPKQGDTPASTELLPPDVFTREIEEIPYLSLAYGEYDPEAYYFAELAQAIESERAYLSSLTPLERLAYATYAPLWHSSPAIPAPHTTSRGRAHTPYSHDPPVEITSQYHAQDEHGQYSYGYSGGPSTKSETRTADGITRGEYSYIDGEGKVQSVHYVADPVNGFRAIGTNIPATPAAPTLETAHDTAEAAAAKEEHPAAA